jgi:hypothetical protein
MMPIFAEKTSTTGAMPDEMHERPWTLRRQLVSVREF